MRPPISKITRAKWIGGVSQVAECLLCKCKALSSIPSRREGGGGGGGEEEEEEEKTYTYREQIAGKRQELDLPSQEFL
jgi:hypothetical protein